MKRNRSDEPAFDPKDELISDNSNLFLEMDQNLVSYYKLKL